MSEYEEVIYAAVVLPGDERYFAELAIWKSDDVIIFVLDGKELFRMDWSENFVLLMERIRIMWKEEN